MPCGASGGSVADGSVAPQMSVPSSVVSCHGWILQLRAVGASELIQSQYTVNL